MFRLQSRLLYYQLFIKYTKSKMFCKYCPQNATGINYRPNSSMDNIPACLNHATALFIPFSGTPVSSDKPFLTKLQQLLQKLMDSIVAEFNLIKSEVIFHEEQMRKVNQLNAMTYQMKCQITTPYIIIPADEELLLATMIKRIKYRYQREKVEKERSSLYNSRILQNQTELLKSRVKSNTNKNYLFFTPQSTERSRFERGNMKQYTKIPQSNTIVKKRQIDEDKA